MSAPEEKPGEGPGFMDLQALARRAQEPPTVPPPAEGVPAEPVLELEPSARTNDGPRGPGDERARMIRNAVGIAFGLLAILAIAALLLPTMLERWLVSKARDVGLTLTIERVGVSVRGFTLHGVTVTAPALPVLTVRAGEVVVQGGTARNVAVVRASATVAASPGGSPNGEEAAALYERTLASLAGDDDAPRRVVVVGATLAVEGVLGTSATHASNIDVTMDLRKKSREVRASVGRLDVRTDAGNFGPWAATLEDTERGTRARLIFDPPVPDGPHALVLWPRGQAPVLTVDVARTRLSNLGVPALGDAVPPTTEIAASLERRVDAARRVVAKGKLELFGVRLAGFASPLDVIVEGQAQGLAGAPLTLDKTTATVGPFVANLAGTVTEAAGGVRLDGSFRTKPIPCSDIARGEAKKIGVLASFVHDAAVRSGAVRVTGSAQAQGTFAFDSRLPNQGAIGLSTAESCGLSLFGNRP